MKGFDPSVERTFISIFVLTQATVLLIVGALFAPTFEVAFIGLAGPWVAAVIGAWFNSLTASQNNQATQAKTDGVTKDGG